MSLIINFIVTENEIITIGTAHISRSRYSKVEVHEKDDMLNVNVAIDMCREWTHM